MHQEPVLVTPLRPTADDLDAAVRLERAALPGSTISIEEEMQRPWAHVWAARLGTEAAPPAALLVFWLVADEIHVLSLATSEAERRKGLARRLLSELVTFARGHGVRLLLLEVRRSNQAAIQLYTRTGFAISGVRQGYYGDTGEDAIEMVLVLDAATGNIETPCNRTGPEQVRR